ncbi:hypothetical protein BJV78DRAFT_1279621 [Lactifluus subvellereus]|nr:hypothetical protein BJV78DRAFT_1279621 [Lactifluus subvellereus]
MSLAAVMTTINVIIYGSTRLRSPISGRVSTSESLSIIHLEENNTCHFISLGKFGMNSATGHHDLEFAPHGANYGDSSSVLFSMYLTRAEKFDKEQSESWKANADGILVFTGLFSATVATFIVEGYKKLGPDSGNATVSILAQISQQLAGLSNGTYVSPLDPAVIMGSSFRPTTSAVWVNALWFSSLVTSLTCALLATLLQQWARRYLRRTQRRYSPHARARIRAFFAEGADKFRVTTVVEFLPALLHISVFLFFAGLVIFLFDINHSIASVILALVTVCGLSYTMFTVIPILFHDSPFQTPLTTAAWYLHHLSMRAYLIVAKHLLAGFSKIIGFAAWRIQDDIKALSDRSTRYLRLSMSRSLEDIARQQSWGMDARALAWTLDTLDEDHELEQFMAGVPGFYQSRALTTGKAILGSLSGPNGFNKILPWKILEVVEHATDGDHYPLEVRQRRHRTCLNALYFIPGAVYDILSAFCHASYPPRASLPRSLESWGIAAELSPHIDDDVALGARCVAAVIATHTTFSDTFRSTVLREDDGHFPILVRQFGVQEHVLHSYLAGNGEDIRLVNLVSFVWLTVKFARNMEASLMALTTGQWDIIVAERARLRSVRSDSTRSWDFQEVGGGKTFFPHHISPPLALAVNHDLLRLTLEYLSDPSFYDTPAPELLGDFQEAWDHVENLQRDARQIGHSTHGFSMILEVLHPLRAQLMSRPLLARSGSS